MFHGGALRDGVGKDLCKWKMYAKLPGHIKLNSVFVPFILRNIAN